MTEPVQILGVPGDHARRRAPIAIEYGSGPVEHPALQMRIFLVPFASERAHIERETGLFVGFEHRRYAVHGRTDRRFLKARCLDDGSPCAGEGQLRVARKGHRDAVHNKPFVRCAAVVGLSGLQEIVFSVIIKVTGRRIATFSDVEPAKEFLVSEDE